MPSGSPVFVMGVSGSGKSTLGEKLANELGYVFLDADSYHDASAIDMMRRGVPLTDKERTPWMARIIADLHAKQRAGDNIVLAISGLKRTHRQQLLSVNESAIAFVLEVEKSVLRERLDQRQSHFFSPELLDSQLAAQESVYNETNTFVLDGHATIEALLAACQKEINENT